MPPVPPVRDDRFLSACRRRAVDRPPIWLMRQAGRYLPEYRKLRESRSILQLARTPELACEVTLQPLRRFKFDAAILFSDILMPAAALGRGVRFVPGPVIDRPLRSARDIEQLSVDKAIEGLSCVFEAARLVRRELAGKVPLIGFAGAPFTLASYLIEGGPSRDFLKTKGLMLEEPKAWRSLMGKLAGLTVSYLKRQISAGAQAVQLFDSWVGCLSPEEFRAAVLPYSRRLFSALRPAGAPTIYFGTGTAGFLEDFASAGADVVGVDWRVDLGAAIRRVGPRAVQGNLDPVALLGPRRALRAAAQGVLDQARGRKGHIFNLGHGVLPQTPPENVAALVEWVAASGNGKAA